MDTRFLRNGNGMPISMKNGHIMQVIMDMYVSILIR